VLTSDLAILAISLARPEFEIGRDRCIDCSSWWFELPPSTRQRLSVEAGGPQSIFQHCGEAFAGLWQMMLHHKEEANKDCHVCLMRSGSA
jgi:hypothetical protein